MVFISFANRKNSKLSYPNFNEGQSSPINKFDIDVLIKWAEENPEERFYKLGKSITPWENHKLNGLKWTEIAMMILYKAPNPAKVVRIYIEKFQPSGWSGSLAPILEKRYPLIGYLIKDSNSIISEEAKKGEIIFKRKIEDTRKFDAEDFRMIEIDLNINMVSISIRVIKLSHF